MDMAYILIPKPPFRTIPSVSKDHKKQKNSNIILHPILSPRFLHPQWSAYQNKKAELTKGLSFGSSGMLKLVQHTPAFLPPYERSGFIGN
jgi:hypothetical protein